MELLVLKDIKKSFGNNQVLKGIDLTINKGEFFTFLGPSGCGKTTLLRIIAGFVGPDKGRVEFNNRDITNIPPEKREIGLVFQNYALFPFMNVFENVAYGLKINKEKKSIIEERVNRYLNLVNLTGYGKRKVSELSGGEQQRVALARSLVLEPELLLLDEPLSNLDARLRDKMRTELKEIQSQLGITTIFVTHDQTEALTMSDRIAVFNGGECVDVGTPSKIYREPETLFVADFIGDMNIVNGKAVRPQDILIYKTKEKGSIEGRINKVNLNGALIEYMVQIDDFTYKVIKLNKFIEDDIFNIGDKVFLYIEPSAVKIFN